MKEIKSGLSSLILEVVAVKNVVAEVCTVLSTGINSTQKSLANVISCTMDASNELMTAVGSTATALSNVIAESTKKIENQLELIRKATDKVYSLFEHQDIKDRLASLDDKLFEVLLALASSAWSNRSSSGGSGGWARTQKSGRNSAPKALDGDYNRPLALPPAKSGEDDIGGIVGTTTSGIVGDILVGTGLVDESVLESFDALATMMKDSAAATWLQNAATTAWQGISTAATAVTTAFGAAMNFLASPIGLVVIAIVALIAIIVLLIANWDTVKAAVLSAWEAIVNAFGVAAKWFNENVIQPVVKFFTQLWANISGFAVDAWTAIKETFLAVANWFNTNVIQPVAGFFAGLWEGFKQAAASAWDGVKSVFSAVAGFFKDIFGAAWAGVVKVFSAAGNIFNNIKDGILSVFKTIVNGLIDGINAVVAVPFKGINGALSIIKNIEIVGAKPFGGLKLLSIPQIPHLARGAVLPANRPFMAIVGDQRHGTNVEAPLSVIQEAVALVMEDQTAAIVSGFNASIGVQREILGAVLGIQIGDEMIAAAADRYHRKMAVMKGA